MRRLLPILVLCLASPTIHAQALPSSGHYLFAWTGDAANKGNDFLAVIDADPASKTYGQLITTLPTDQPTKLVHHTEYVMPAEGMLFANDHEAGRTFLFDLRDPVHPKIANSFYDVDGYMHPHSYVRLPNGHVLVTFQHAHHGDGHAEQLHSGALVELDQQGKFVRASSNVDPAFSDSLLTPYSLVVLPHIDRVISTNSSMNFADGYGTTYQLWRLSDLKLLKTESFDPGHNLYGHADPEEPRLAPDGSILVQTFSCGLQRITGMATDTPRATLVHTFPGGGCGVPTVVGHYLIESDRLTHGLIVLDIANPASPVEVSRLQLSSDYSPHWTGWDPETQRLVVTPNADAPTHRLYLLKLDQSTGILTIDTAFHDDHNNPGFDFDNRQWPHGWNGSGAPHGAVFSR
jgi:56kDa selenium binding protein (SBP56)